jgi:hypothetical protein
MLSTYVPAASPVALGDSLSFLGAAAYHSGDALDVETWWEVTARPVARPFSILGHLLSPQGEIVERFDGLGLSPLALLAGDVLVQRHRFAASAGEAEVWLRTGAYWQDTMERWTVGNAPEVTTLLVHLQVRE